MAISETAQKNHDELFPGHVSTLKVTDPELIEAFDNFAFDETLRHTRLDPRTRLMAQLAALISCQALREYQVMLGAALANGVTPVEAKEIGDATGSASLSTSSTVSRVITSRDSRSSTPAGRSVSSAICPRSSPGFLTGRRLPPPQFANQRPHQAPPRPHRNRRRPQAAAQPSTSLIRRSLHRSCTQSDVGPLTVMPPDGVGCKAR
jgi:alkylhydroperoxidase/carboxymuconolactone decarboxylase family protein YurZ